MVTRQDIENEVAFFLHLIREARMNDLLLQFFSFKHLPPRLQTVSAKFAELAVDIDKTLPDNEEKHMALRKLLEAKDCAVRAMLYES